MTEYSEDFKRMIEGVNKPTVKNVMTKGVSDEVLSWYFGDFQTVDGKTVCGYYLIGHVGFHDWDGDDSVFINKMTKRAAIELDTVIALLQTNKGYHLVSFEIMDGTKWWAWKWWMRKNLESYYLDGICHQCLIMMETKKSENDNILWVCSNCGRSEIAQRRKLRIDIKGMESKPKLIAWYKPTVERAMKMSAGHVLKYREAGIIDTIPYPDFQLANTVAMILPYEAEARVA